MVRLMTVFAMTLALAGLLGLAGALWARAVGLAGLGLAVAVLAAGGAVWVTASGGARSPHAAVAGLPLPANFTLMPVLTPTGQEMLVNAHATPVVFVSPRDGAAVKPLAAAYNRVSGIKRPLLLVVTGFATSDTAEALAQAHRAMDRTGTAMAWVAQLGPATTYVARTPTLVYANAAGRLQRVTGWAAIGRALRTAVRGGGA